LISARHRTLITLWAAQFMALVMFFVFTRLVRPEEPPEPNPMLLAVLGLAALVAVGASFAFKAMLLGRSRAERSAPRAHTAYVLAFALCEAAALFGVMAHFVIGAPEAVYFFALAALGLLLHFPRRQHFTDPPPAGAGFTDAA